MELATSVFVGSRVGVIDHFVQLGRRTNYSRRNKRMRALVDDLLNEIRRLNAVAQDGKRGVRGAEETTRLMDTSETEIGAIVKRIRETAAEQDDQPLEAQ